MILDQSEYDIRCEWGHKGASLLGPVSDVIIVVDVLSFSTAVEVATSQGAVVYPYRWKDETAYDFAKSISAEVADGDNANGYCLSPASLKSLPTDIRMVLPSPNGSHICFSTGATPTMAGCLRNCRAVAESAMRKGRNITVIAAGERWEDDSLRPCFEDMVGAGAIIRHLSGTLSPEAEAAAAVFERVSSSLLEHIKRCSSGKEKISRGEERDLVLASELNVSGCVPLLTDGAFKREA
jgi:2-phosphosulfolactate phosphatase